MHYAVEKCSYNVLLPFMILVDLLWNIFFLTKVVEIVKRFEILIIGTKPSEVWVIGGLTSFIFARFVSLDWWMLTVVGVWRY